MHCWKIINVDRDFGTARIILLSVLTFIITFSLSYVLLNINRVDAYTDRYLWINIIGLIILYPVHKIFHYLLIIDYTKKISIKIRIRFRFIPIVHLKIKHTIPKYRYLASLLAPFILFNSILLVCAVQFPTYSHYISIYFGIHCAICLIDLLNVKGIINAPKHAIIEETPKGYEVLVPLE